MLAPGEKDGPGGLVWLERGEERPFEPLPERRRPWLEESTGWGAPADGGGREPDEPDAPSELVWL